MFAVIITLLALGAGVIGLLWLGLTIRQPAWGFLFAAAAASLGMLSHLLAPAGWPFEPVANLAPQMAVFGVIAGFAALAARQWTSGIVLISCAAVHLSVVNGHPGAAPDAGLIGDRDTAIGAVFVNAQRNTRALTALAAFAANTQADLIGIAEMPSDADLDALFADFPHRAGVALAANGEDVAAPRAVLLSRIPILPVSAGGSSRHRGLTAADLERANGDLVRVIVAHPYPPISPRMARDRDAIVQRVGKLVENQARFIVMGDFNAAPWSPVFEALPGRRAGDARWISTWLTPWFAAGLPIDHILISDDFSVVEAGPGRFIGSDHRPVTATLVGR